MVHRPFPPTNYPRHTTPITLIDDSELSAPSTEERNDYDPKFTYGLIFGVVLSTLCVGVGWLLF
jgi:hypothetical protein